MKLLGVAALTAILTVGLAVGTAHAAKAKRVASLVEISGYSYPPPDDDFAFSGDVHSKKNKCEKGRTVTILGLDDPSDEGTVMATLTTDATGDWEYEPQVATPYVVAEVERKEVRTRGGKKLICKPDTSDSFAVL